MLKLLFYLKTQVSHRFGRSRLNGCSILIKLSVDYPKGANYFFLQNVEFPGIVEEWTRLKNNSSIYLGEGKDGRGTSHNLVARTRMLVNVASDLASVANTLSNKTIAIPNPDELCYKNKYKQLLTFAFKLFHF